MFACLRVYDYDLIQNKKIVRHKLLKSDELDMDTFKKYIYQKYENRCDVIDFYQFLYSITPGGGDQCRIQYIGSGTYGNAFKFSTFNEKFKKTNVFCVKFSLFLKYQGYKKKNIFWDPTRPENVEHQMLFYISNIFFRENQIGVVQPFFSGLIGYESYAYFLKQQGPDIATEELLKGEKQKRHNQKFVKFLVCEYCQEGNLCEFFKKKISKNVKDVDQHFIKYVFFQIFYCLFIIQKYFPNFKHNDLKSNNILVQKIPQKTMIFDVDGVRFEFETNEFCIKLWDFDFSCMNGIIDNIKCKQKWANDHNIDQEKNHFQDIFYFVKTFLKSNKANISMLKKFNIESYRALKQVSQYILQGEETYQQNKQRVPSSVQHMDPKQILIDSGIFNHYVID